MRYCKSCEQSKNTSEFRKDSSSYTGHSSICRHCEDIISKSSTNSKKYANILTQFHEKRTR